MFIEKRTIYRDREFVHYALEPNDKEYTVTYGDTVYIIGGGKTTIIDYGCLAHSGDFEITLSGVRIGEGGSYPDSPEIIMKRVADVFNQQIMEHDNIEKRAYFIWEKTGNNNTEENWYQASQNWLTGFLV